MDILAGGFLLVSWGACWYFFFFRASSGVRSYARIDRLFAGTSFATGWLLLLYGALMWVIPPQPPAGMLPFFAACITVAGQWLMCASRAALPLSTYDVVMRITTARVSTGPYAYVSHPMYVGLLAALLGSSLLLGNTPATLVLIPLTATLVVRAWAERRA